MIYDAGKMEGLFRSEACIVVKYIRPVDLVGMLEHINTIIYLAFPYTYETVNTLLIIIITVIIVILIIMMIINILFDTSVWHNKEEKCDVRHHGSTIFG